MFKAIRYIYTIIFKKEHKNNSSRNLKTQLNKKRLNFIVSSGSSFLTCENNYLIELINFIIFLVNNQKISKIEDHLPDRKQIKNILISETTQLKLKIFDLIKNIFFLMISVSV